MKHDTEPDGSPMLPAPRLRERIDDEPVHDERQQSPVALLGCVVAVYICWATHDYLQERVFKFPGFRFGFFMAFVLQLSSFVLALLQRIVTALCVESTPLRQSRQQSRELVRVDEERTMLEEEEEEAAGPSARSTTQLQLLGWYLLLSALIATANGTSSAALNYVNMQMKLVVKNGKIVTVMLLGTLLFGKRYLAVEYGYMLLVACGLVVFFLAASVAALHSSLTGVALLAVAVLSDSMLPNVQQRLLRELNRPKAEVVYHTNWISALLTLGYITYTGELQAALSFLRVRRRVALLLLLQSGAGYLGILSYLETVRRFGPKATTIVTSSRKLFTIALSSVLFGHPLNGYHVAGVAAVFLGVLLNANANLACSRALVLPALAAAAALLASQLLPPEIVEATVSPATVASWPAWLSPVLSWLSAVRALASVRLLN